MHGKALVPRVFEEPEGQSSWSGQQRGKVEELSPQGHGYRVCGAPEASVKVLAFAAWVVGIRGCGARAWV